MHAAAFVSAAVWPGLGCTSSLGLGSAIELPIRRRAVAIPFRMHGCLRSFFLFAYISCWVKFSLFSMIVFYYAAFVSLVASPSSSKRSPLTCYHSTDYTTPPWQIPSCWRGDQAGAAPRGNRVVEGPQRHPFTLIIPFSHALYDLMDGKNLKQGRRPYPAARSSKGVRTTREWQGKTRYRMEIDLSFIAIHLLGYVH